MEMKSQNYTVAIEFAKSPNDVFNHVTNLSKWWPEEFEGESIKLNAEFVLKTGDGHYSKNKVIEFVPNKKIVWLTTESRRKTDNFDWTGTKMIFELAPNGGSTLLKFTYDGVVLENESDRLLQICDFVIKEKLYNLIESFTATIEVAKSPNEVFPSITQEVQKWWGGRDYTGCSSKLDDEFIINHPGSHYSKQRLIEVVQNKKIVWHVEESKLNWLKTQDEWANTRMIFEITPKGDSSILRFTHEGLVPEKESYARCSEGWNQVIREWLFDLIVIGKPHFAL
jgi:uncharacterized protein YndB with AHSA1/START domain